MENKVQVAVKNVLFAIVNDFSFMDKLEQYNYSLKPSDFDSLGAVIFNAAMEYRNKAPRMTEKMLEDKYIKKDEFMSYFEGMDKDFKANFELYLGELMVHKAMQEFSKTAEELKKASEKVSGSDAVKKAEAFVQHVKKRIDNLKPIKKGSIGKNMMQLNKEFEELKQGLPIKTGIDAIDEIFAFKRGGVNLLTGVSNQGKTTFAIQCIIYAVCVLKLKVLFINLEMDSADIYAKIMGLLSQEGYKAHNIEEFDAADAKSRAEHAKRSAEDKKLIQTYIQDNLILKTGTYTDEMILQELTDAEREGVDMVLIDYFQLVTVGGSDKEKTAKLSKLQENARAIVRESNYALVWLAQLNEEKGKDKDGNPLKSPLEYDIAWCKDLYKGADVEIRVWREYDNIKERTFTPYIYAGLPKTRFINRTGKIELGFDGKVGRIAGFSVQKTDKEMEEIKAANPYHEDSYYDDYTDYSSLFGHIEVGYNMVEDFAERARMHVEEQKRREEYLNAQEEETLDDFMDVLFTEEA
jgi:replicative DNA helicase